MKLGGAWRVSAIGLAFLGGCAAHPGASEFVHSLWALNATPLDRSAAELENDTQEHLAWAKTLRDRILSVTDPRTMENTLVPYNTMMMHLEAAQSECALFARVHPDGRVRATALDGELAVLMHMSALAVDRELYEVLQELDTSRADAETQYAVHKILRQFRKDGIDQPAETRTRIAELQREIAELTQAIVWYKSEHNRVHWGELPDMLDRIRIAHDEVAQLAGYSTWGDYAAADTMAGSLTSVRSFVQTVADISKAPAERECAVLQERAHEGAPGTTVPQGLDMAACAQLAAKQTEVYDPLLAEARSYFGFPDVLQSLFDITQKSFGVTYRQVHGLNLWHEDVTAWDVNEGDERIGRFYVDWRRREGKWGWTTHFTYRTGVAGECLPQSVIVCSFGPGSATPEGVILLEHVQVADLFSAFGHMLHNILGGRHRWIRTSGISNEADFIEAAGKIMREWCYKPEVLSAVARHYKTGQPIPSTLAEHVCRVNAVGKSARIAFRASDTLAALGLQSKDPGEFGAGRLMDALERCYCAGDGAQGRHFQSQLQYLMCYPAGCCAGLWSDMIARDILGRFEREGMLNPKTGRRYRNTVLEPGGSKKADELVKGFLGRPYSVNSFQQWLEQ